MNMLLERPDMVLSAATVPPNLAQPLAARIRRYWSHRAPDFGRLRREELQSDKFALWYDEIAPRLPAPLPGRALRILDVGTGPGFFAVLLAGQRHEVIGIDICSEMLQEAERLARGAACQVTFLRMDASRLNFPDQSFDCVLTRNLTWTLLRPGRAYAEWLRVLRPGGVLLNFDADYGVANFMDAAKEEGRHAHAGMDSALLREGENIRRSLAISRETRPVWDMAMLRRVGFSSCTCDTALSSRVFTRRDSAYNPVPMFALRAVR